MTRRLILLLGLFAALLFTTVPAVGAHNGVHASSTLPTRIDLPDGFQPEGIASAFKTRLYVGSVANGAIWRDSAKTGEGRILVEGVTGRRAAGIHIDGRGRLWVAGAEQPHGPRLQPATGRLLETYTFATEGFINDLVITRNAVYATESNFQQLAVVPLGAIRAAAGTRRRRSCCR